MPELLLGLDVGTTSARALLADLDGHVLAVAKRPIETVFPGPGRAEQDAEAVWRLARAVIEDALALVGRNIGDVAAMGVTNQRASLVVWRRSDGAPAAPMVLWSDLSGVQASRTLREAGFPSWPQAPACKLNALLERCGDGDFLWGGLDSYLVYRLSGGAAHVTDLSNAWMTGCFDPEAGGWNGALLDHLRVPQARFPRVVDSWGAVASASALGAKTSIAAIVGDQQAGLFAHAALGEGGWKATLGTSGVVMASTGQTPRRPHPTMPPEAVARGGGRTIYGVEGMVITAGSAVDWMCGRLGLFESPAALFDAAATGEPGVVLRPSLSGLGAPYARFDAQGLIGGLHPGAGRAELARALMEGLAFRLREICATIAANIPVEQTLGVDGGLSGSEIFLQHLADCLGQPVRRLAAREGSAMGAALAAALGTGLLDLADLSSRARYDRTFEPRTAADESEAAYAAWSAAVNPGGVSRP